MKIREDFVTNSSSSSFIITNTSDEPLTSEEIARMWFEQIIEDAKGRFELKPGESITYECGDHSDDGAFENFIHGTFDGWGSSYLYDNDKVEVQFHESHH